jgi:two-component system, cell cycle response regulator DivK
VESFNSHAGDGTIDNMEPPKKRILIVEDFEDSRFSLSKLLQIEGYEVVEATNGAQAVELAETVKPDLILMDLSLPVVDGLSATRIIRENPSLAAVPIIALSGHDLAEVQREAQMAGCTDYLMKPIDFDGLKSMISKYLRS